MPAPKGIVVFLNGKHLEKYEGIFSRSQTECRVHTAQDIIDSRTILARVFKRASPHEPQIKAAHQFVVQNYQPGDHVMLLGGLFDHSIGSPEYSAVQRLATLLNDGDAISISREHPASGKIPIKCIYLVSCRYPRLQWSWVDQMLLDFPPTVENMLCLGSETAYAVQRGGLGWVIRKEAWLSDGCFWQVSADWLMLQTSHIIDYNPVDLVHLNNPSGQTRGIGQLRLLSSATHLNYTRRRQGVPCKDAIPTGGLFTQVSKVALRGPNGNLGKGVVWSSQRFLEGEHDNVSSLGFVGPRLS
ncbi:hypothetical protein BDV93DRAFT_608216 [Ceratobasidium sp. AG-I]|nr:hypothetical protein BDV93DRAFT_608216 [Ceratobasidium sp. AG-I]